MPMAIVMPNTVHTGYAQYPESADKFIDEYATPLVIAYNGYHHYTATKWSTPMSDGPYIKVARFLGQMDSALFCGLNLIAQLKDHEIRHQLSKVAEETQALKSIFQ